MNAEPMVALTVCRTVLDTAKQLDIDICSLALEAGADPAVFDSIDGRIPTRAYIALFEGAQSRSGRADFALEVGRRFRPGTPHGVGQATKRARNLQEAWRYLAHYWRLVAEGTAFRLVAEEPTPPDSTASAAAIVFEVTDASLSFPRDTIESLAVGHVAFARWLTQQHLRPREVQLPFDQPDHFPALQDFFGAPLVFNAKRAKTIWDLETLEHPVVDSVHDTPSLMAQEPSKSDAFMPRMRQTIADLLVTQSTTIDAIAAALDVSPAYIQQQLNQADVSFLHVVDDVQRSLTLHLLADPALPLEEVAFLSGFTEHRAFYHAVRRWTEMTPGQWRNHAKSDQRTR